MGPDQKDFLSAIILGAIVNIACVASITGAQIMLAPVAPTRS